MRKDNKQSKAMLSHRNLVKHILDEVKLGQVRYSQ